jgi:prevent-host-death family protein
MVYCFSQKNKPDLVQFNKEKAMQTINIHEAKTQFSRFIDQAAAGEDIIIARAGKPIARLTSLEAQSLQPRKLGLGKTRFTMPQDFDHLYADEIQNMFEQGEPLV